MGVGAAARPSRRAARRRSGSRTARTASARTNFPLLIAGDVFDTANAPASAQQQLYQFLCAAKLNTPHLQVVIIAGNHDSPTRLEVPMPFLSAFDMVVIGQVTRQHQQIDVERMVIPLKNRQGEVKAWCLAIPFLRPSDVPKVDNAKDAYLEGIAALYQQATDCALDKRETGQAIIAMGHCHMLGSQVSEDSERKLVMGGIESLSSAIFAPEISYVALGHLHLAQKVGGDDRAVSLICAAYIAKQRAASL